MELLLSRVHRECTKPQIFQTYHCYEFNHYLAQHPEQVQWNALVVRVVSEECETSRADEVLCASSRNTIAFRKHGFTF